MNRPTLSTLLAQRTLRRGEAVTVLAPLLHTLDDLHSLDCTNGRISLETVVFDDSGRPIFDAWQQCIEHRRGETLDPEFRPAMLDDYRAFVELARLVLSRTQPQVPQAAHFLAEDLERLERGRRAPFVGECEKAIFALGHPEPIDPFEPYRWGSESSQALATVAADVTEWQRSDRDAARLRARIRAAAERLRQAAAARRGSVVGWLTNDERDARARSADRQKHRRGARLRLISVGAVVCSCAVGGALFALPSGTGRAGATEHQVAAPTVSSSAPIRDPTSVDTGSTVEPPNGSAGTAADGADIDGEGLDGAGLDEAGIDGAGLDGAAAIGGADPLAAGTALWRLRNECLRLRSLHCLAGVDQALSAALESDSETIEAEFSDSASNPSTESPSGSGRPAEAGEPSAAPVLRLIQAVGATALVEVSGEETVDGSAPNTAPTTTEEPQRKPASLLLVKGEAGWRIREVFSS